MAVSVEAAGGVFTDQIALREKRLGVAVNERTHPIVKKAIEAVDYAAQRAFNDNLTGWGDLMIIPSSAYLFARAINLS